MFEYFSCDLYINSFVDEDHHFPSESRWKHNVLHVHWHTRKIDVYLQQRSWYTMLKIAGIADKMIHKHDGHAMKFMINVLSSKI